MHIVFALAVAVLISAQAGSLQFTAPPTWKTRTSTSSMRVAEFVVPRVQGDPEDAELIVYFFGGSGGSVDANIERWIGQFQPDAGRASQKPARVVSNVGPLKVTSVDVSGTYIAEMRPGSPERFNKPNFRMRAAVVETPKGPYFLKLTGPARTIAQGGAAFDQFVKSLRFK
jgi:hypothetical protein